MLIRYLEIIFKVIFQIFTVMILEHKIMLEEVQVELVDKQDEIRVITQ